MQRELKDQGLVVLAVSIQEKADRVDAWVKKHGIRFPVFLDESGVVTRAWKVTATPTVFLIDRRGRLVGKATGTKPWTSAPGRALLAALLAS